ncbi:hypothetical protein KBD87_04380 [Candidatus Saccharibacteria bacterium]|nr:hypothetical protein [Candidatus Saccharibacteria bacterium]
MDPNQQPQQPTEPVPVQPQTPFVPQPTPEAAMQSSAPEAPVQQPNVAPTQQYAPSLQVGQPMQAMPNTPMQPAQTMPAMQPTMSAAPASNKKTIILVSVIVGVFVIAGIVAAVAMSMFSVSKKDYSAALEQYNTVSSANTTLNSKLSMLGYGVSSSTDTTFSNDMASAKDALANVKTENDALAKLKAVTIGEGAEKYKIFSAKLKSSVSYIGDLLTSLEHMRPAANDCGASKTTGSTISSIQSSIQTCITALENVGSLPNPDVKKFVDTTKASYTSLSSIVGKIASIKNPYGSQYDEYKALREKMYDEADAITNAGSDMRSNFEKATDEFNPKDAADDLSKFLRDKALE